MATNTIETRPIYIWEGIYDSFQSAAAETIGASFGSEIYLKRSLVAANDSLTELNGGSPIPQFHKQRSTLLPITVSMMLCNNERVRILDFGGGLGVGYMTLAESISDDLKIGLHHCGRLWGLQVGYGYY